MLKEIFRLSEAKIIRVIGLLGIVKDEKGNIEAAQITELSDEDRIKLSAGIGALIGLGAAGKKGALAGAQAGAERAAGKEFGLDTEDIMAIADEIFGLRFRLQTGFPFSARGKAVAASPPDIRFLDFADYLVRRHIL